MRLILSCLCMTAFVAAAPVERKAEPFPLSRVRLLDGPFRDAMVRNSEYLLRLSPDRLLARFRQAAGLEPKGESYGGWEMTDLAGHSLGHYLSAVAFTHAATGDARFKERADYIVAELAACQQRHKDKLVDAKTERRPEVWYELARGEMRDVKRHYINGSWAPWYAIHKTYAGLRDAALYTGNRQAEEVLAGLSDWAETIVGDLDDAQMERMLDCEIGGMNEVLADAYELSRKPLHLELARKFYHKGVLDPLAAGRDELAKLHANTQIPKIIGQARLYDIAGEKRDRDIAEFFFRTVLENYTYANGGNSDKEWFGQPKALSQHMSGSMTETCNTYNMLRLATFLFAWEPRASIMDYYERALWNQIYSSQDRKTGMFTYKLGLYGGWFQSFSSPEDDFWCCVGTGMENHARYGEAVYFHKGDALWVNLFVPSELDWSERGVRVRQQTKFPYDSTSAVTISTGEPKRLVVHVRYPSWAASDMTVRINGQGWKHKARPGSYIAIDRTWRDGDTITLAMPFRLRHEATPDNPNRIALFYGPVLLAGLFGTDNMPQEGPYGKAASDEWRLPNPAIPPLVGIETPWADRMKPVAGKPLTFRARTAGTPPEVTLVPVWESHHQRFTVYWDAYTTPEWKRRQQTTEK